MKKTLEYYDWMEVQNALCTHFGRSVRDFAGRFGKDGETDAPYLDFLALVGRTRLAVRVL